MGNGDELWFVDSGEVLGIGRVEGKSVGDCCSGYERIIGTGYGFPSSFAEIVGHVGK